jgi:hypothetical protein
MEPYLLHIGFPLHRNLHHPGTIHPPSWLSVTSESTSSRNHTSSILAFRYIGIYIIHIHSDRVYLNPNPSQYMKRKNKSREEITKTKNVKTNQVNEESIREHGHAKPNKEMMH